jgi:hypothetical protein
METKMTDKGIERYEIESEDVSSKGGISQRF